MARSDLFSPLKYYEQTVCADDAIRLTLADDSSDQFFLQCPSRTNYSLFREFLARLPAKKHVQHGYLTPATDTTVDLCRALWPNVELTDDTTRAAYHLLSARSALYDCAAEITAEFRATHLVPARCGYIEHNEAQPLAAYQYVATSHLLRHDAFALFMEQGTGKTPCAIAAICNLAAARENKDRMYRAIIVCPNNIRANWESEFEKFTTRACKVTVIRGTEFVRLRQLIDAVRHEPKCEFTAIIIGYDSFVAMQQVICAQPWDIAILDESHFVKDQKTQRARACHKLRDKSATRIILTGTPVCNNCLDLYSQLEFLGKGYSGFRTWEDFRRFYGVFDSDANGFERVVATQNLPFMRERLARYSYIVRKEEALPDLPAKIYDMIEVEMCDEQQCAYDKLAAELALVIERELSYDNIPREMVCNNILTQLLRLAQITSGFAKWDNGDVTYFDPNPKIAAVLELLAEKSPQQKTLIWACFQPDIDYLHYALEYNNIDHVIYDGRTKDDARNEAVHRFNHDANCKVLIGNQQAGGVGLNLLGYPPGSPELAGTYCDHVIYYSQNWSQPQRSQSEDRAHRRGTLHPVRVTDICVPHSIDDEIRARVTGKRIHAIEVQDVREILQRIMQ